MPELPEVEVTRRGLAPHLVGQVIAAVEVREPRLRWPIPRAVRALAGCTVRSLRRRGKYLLVDCGDGHLILHLGMSGSLRLRDPRRFGAVLWTERAVDEHPLIAHLGVEIGRASCRERV